MSRVNEIRFLQDNPELRYWMFGVFACLEKRLTRLRLSVGDESCMSNSSSADKDATEQRRVPVIFRLNNHSRKGNRNSRIPVALLE